MGNLSQKIEKYILENYVEPNVEQMMDDTSYSYLELKKTIRELEDDHLIKWGRDGMNYQLNDHLDLNQDQSMRSLGMGKEKRLDEIRHEQISLQKELGVMQEAYMEFVADQEESIRSLSQKQEKELNAVRNDQIAIQNDIAVLKDEQSKFMVTQDKYNLSDKVFYEQVTLKLKSIIVVFGIINTIILLLILFLVFGVL